LATFSASSKANKNLPSNGYHFKDMAKKNLMVFRKCGIRSNVHNPSIPPPLNKLVAEDFWSKIFCSFDADYDYFSFESHF
jgi:hypothetical protein